jgi:polyisoprenoid-binding protein YceI
MKTRMLVLAVAVLGLVAGHAAADALKFSGEKSKIEFTGTKKGGKHDGGFKQFTGTIDLPGTDFAKATVKLEIDMTSIFTDNNSVTNHLKTPDFFDVRTHPKANFVSTGIKPTTANGATHEITGNLTLHGVTKPVTVPVKVTTDASGTTLEGTFTIKRLDFNVNYRPEAVHNDVTVRLTVKAAK